MVLRNRYFICRHGRSLANEAGEIVSHVARGVLPEYGLLSPTGFEQAQAAGSNLVSALQAEPMNDIAMYTSPFSRAKQTAECLQKALAASGVEVELVEAHELRERYFGVDYEGKGDSLYKQVWAIDEKDPTKSPCYQNNKLEEKEQGESVMDVATRVAAFVTLLEERHRDTTVVLVSHGDTLQITSVVVRAIAERGVQALPTVEEAQRHRAMYSMQTGELRELS
eukprot:m.345320 g.345320  ORF g.345320 m.345320 type:complete len:224 (+) comp26110_c0_seq1:131-802(+)